MKRPTFFEGVGVALTASLTGGALFSVLSASFAGSLVIRLLIAAIGFAYILYLLRRSRERVGRIVVVAGWLLAAAGIGFLHLPLVLYLVLHIGLVWLVRSLYFYSSVLSSLADLGLTGLALAAAVWALSVTGSLLLGLWCFFLVQALFVGIPNNLPRKSATASSAADVEDHFQHAHQVAQAALRKLSSVH
jgi:predicted membrane channel-forming protein YqfA (hemolysin III family)